MGAVESLPAATHVDGLRLHLRCCFYDRRTLLPVSRAYPTAGACIVPTSQPVVHGHLARIGTIDDPGSRDCQLETFLEQPGHSKSYLYRHGPRAAGIGN